MKGIRVLESSEIFDAEDTEQVIPSSVWTESFPEETVTMPSKLTLCYEDGKVQQVFHTES